MINGLIMAGTSGGDDELEMKLRFNQFILTISTSDNRTQITVPFQQFVRTLIYLVENSNQRPNQKTKRLLAELAASSGIVPTEGE